MNRHPITELTRAAMAAAGVPVPPEEMPLTSSEHMLEDSLGLTIAEVRFARRIGCTPEKYSASKSIRSLLDHENILEERRRAAR